MQRLDDSDDGGSYEIGATPHSVEIPKDVLDSNAREAALFVGDTEKRLVERLEEQEHAKRQQKEEKMRQEKLNEEEARKREDARLKEEKRRVEEEERKHLEQEEDGSDFDSGISQGSEELHKKPSKKDDEEDEEEEDSDDGTSSEVALATPGAFS